MKKKMKKLIVLVAVMVMCLPMTVMAADQGGSAEISAYLNELNGGNLPSALAGYFQETNNSAEVAQGGTYDATYNYYAVTVNNVTTYYVVEKTAESAAIDAINKVKSTSNFGNDLDTDILDGYDLSADTQAASGLMSGIVPIITTVLGFIVIIATAGMTLYTGFDLLYLIFPTFRGKCDDRAAQGGMGTKQTKDGTNKMMFVTDEAVYAVKTADTVNQGQSPLIIYFKKRILAYILLAILIFILLTGNVNIFAKLAVRAVQGVLDMISGL